MLQAGGLNERVTILVPTVSRGELGEQVAAWNVGAKVWARVVFQKAANALMVGEVWMTRSISVSMRNNDVVNERCRLRWDGKLYEIDSFNRSRADGTISIVATMIDEGNDNNGTC